MSTPTKGEPPRAPRSMMQQQQSRSTSTGGKRGESAERSSSGTRGPQVTSEKSKNSLAKVPCKFFRAGACSNESCPFLHQEQGTPKQICPWYQTQSCKFGAKCALAHVLPGQPMSMDRKNKRAQQLAQREAEATATAAAPNGGGSSGSAATSPAKPPSPLKSPPTTSLSPSNNNNNGSLLTKRQSGFMPTPSQPAATVQSQPILATSPNNAKSGSVWGPNMNPAIKAPPSSASNLSSNGPSRQVGFAAPSSPSTSVGAEPSAGLPDGSAQAPVASASASHNFHQQASEHASSPQNRAAAAVSSNITAAATGPNLGFGQSPRGIILDFLNSGAGAGNPSAAQTARPGAHPELHGDALEYMPQSVKSPLPSASGAAVTTASSAWPTHSHHLSSPQLRGLDMPQSMPVHGTHAFGTSPFSNPGSRSIFLQPSSFGSDDNHLDSVFEGKPSQGKRPDLWSWTGGGRQTKPASFAGYNATLASRPETEIDEEEELRLGADDDEEEERVEEDFLPSSLHDLLTPDELQRAHRAKLNQAAGGHGAHHRRYDLDGASKSFPDHEALLQQPPPPSVQHKWAHHGAGQDQSYAREEPVNGGSPARRMTLLSHAPGTSLPPAINSGMSRMSLQPTLPAYTTAASTAAVAASDALHYSTSPWAAAPMMARDSPPRATPAAAVSRPRRTSHGSTANNPGLFVGSPLAQAWTHPNEDDELGAVSLLQRSADVKVLPPSSQIQHQQQQSQAGQGLADEDEGLPFSMD